MNTETLHTPCIHCGDTTYTQRCMDCLQFYCADTTCLSTVNDRVKPHRMCRECGLKPVCYYKGICRPCDVSCHAITDSISVGSCAASYEGFDRVVDMNYPENGQPFGTISRIDASDGSRTVWKIGMHDRDTAEDLDLLRQAVLFLRYQIKEDNEKGVTPRILFHCFAGYSRSVALAAAYLALKESLSVDEALARIVSVRKYVGPREAFMALLRKEIDP